MHVQGDARRCKLQAAHVHNVGEAVRNFFIQISNCDDDDEEGEHPLQTSQRSRSATTLPPSLKTKYMSATVNLASSFSSPAFLKTNRSSSLHRHMGSSAAAIPAPFAKPKYLETPAVPVQRHSSASWSVTIPLGLPHRVREMPRIAILHRLLNIMQPFKPTEGIPPWVH